MCEYLKINITKKIRMINNAMFMCFAAVLATVTLSRVNGTEQGYQLNPRFHFLDVDLLTYTAEDKKGNVVISPASVKSTLFMLLEGSEGETWEELRRALRLTRDKTEHREQLHIYLSALQTNDSGVTLENANGIFLSDKLKPKKQFSDVIQGDYKSQLTAVNFSDPVKAAESVNNWVANKTHGLIPELVDQMSISPTSSILILNALYFKGTWKHAFNPQLTRPRCFFHGDKCVQVATMQLHMDLNYAYVDELRAHAVELPYENSRFSIILLIPYDKDGCVSVVRDLPHVSLARVVALLDPADVQLSLPRFSVDFSEDLVPALKEARINRLFSSSAELSGILDGDSRGVRVDGVVQRVCIQVTETGTLAAAATGAIVVPLMGDNTVRLKVDRPFLFFIRDNLSGAVLFEGKIEEPELAASGVTPGTRTGVHQL